MLEGKIVGVNPPARIRFLVPTAAEMYSAGSRDATGNYTGGPPDRKASEIPGWDEISYELQTDTFRVEYYDSIIVGQPDKEISYYFQFLYPISDLSVVIQEPRKSTNFTVPPEGTTGTDQEGFTVHRYSYSNLVPASPLHFDIAYTKSDPHPSLSIDAIASGASPTGSTASSGSVNVPLLVGVIAGVCAVVAFIFLINRSRPQPRALRQSAKSARADRRRNAGAKVCSQCGRSLEENHEYCPYCGSKVG